MLTAAYLEALLADANVADRVWHLWNAGDIDDRTAVERWNDIALSVEPLTDANTGRCDSSRHG